MTDPFALPDLDIDHGFVIERHDSVASTQDVLRLRLEEGEGIRGVAVRASTQTSGRGRRGNKWHSARGGSYQSVGLWQTPPAGSAAGGAVPARLLPLALSVGVAAALGRAGAQVLVKWPNDLVLGGRKLGGVVVEMVAGTPIAGIGINVANDVPDGVAALRGWDVETVSDLVLLGVRLSMSALDNGPAAVRSGFAKVDWLRGKSVLLTGMVGPLRADGIDDDGCLLLSAGAGTNSRACSGHVVSVDGKRWGA